MFLAFLTKLSCLPSFSGLIDASAVGRCMLRLTGDMLNVCWKSMLHVTSRT